MYEICAKYTYFADDNLNAKSQVRDFIFDNNRTFSAWNNLLLFAIQNK